MSNPKWQEEELRSQAKEEARKERVESAVAATEQALGKALGAPLSEQSRELARSLGTQAAEGVKDLSARSKLKEPPKGLHFGGRIITERDMAYCTCGQLKETHDQEQCPWGLTFKGKDQ